jgi:hypothetical protein
MALAITLLSVLMNNTNNISDRGSPCLRPRLCQIGGLDSPLSITRVLAVERRIVTSSQNLGPNLTFRST